MIMMKISFDSGDCGGYGDFGVSGNRGESAKVLCCPMQIESHCINDPG